jgi:hypothetical protein
VPWVFLAGLGALLWASSSSGNTAVSSQPYYPPSSSTDSSQATYVARVPPIATDVQVREPTSEQEAELAGGYLQ